MPAQLYRSHSSVSVLLLQGGDGRIVYGGGGSEYSSGGRVRGSSVTVKLDRVDCGGDGSTAVASPLLLGLFVAK